MFSTVFAKKRADCEPSRRRPRKTPNRPPRGVPESWAMGFEEKMSAVKKVAQRQFEQFLKETVLPVFAEITAITSRQGILGTTAALESGSRVFKFTVSKHAYMKMTFGVSGLECDVLNEFSVPHYRAVSPTYESVELLEADRAWARRVFEQALNHFADGLAQRLGSTTFEPPKPSSAPTNGKAASPTVSAGSATAADLCLAPSDDDSWQDDEPNRSPVDERSDAETEGELVGALASAAESERYEMSMSVEPQPQKIRFRPRRAV